MRTLNRKLARDLWGNRGQIVTIALVVAAGLTSLIAMYSTFRSLDGSTRAYYDRYRFGEVFAQARRVPESVATRAGQTPGVQTAYPRIVEWGFVPVEGMPEPAQAQIVSLPRHGEPPLNHIYLRRGRYPEPHRTDEVVVLESFADAHGFEPGDTLPLIMGGTFHRVRIVGIGLSPEFVFFGSRAEVVTDPARAVVIWMSRSAVSAAFQMEGAFNDLVISLQPRANEEAVISAIDRLLQPYGGLGAYGRDRHPSHALVAQETSQLIGSGSVLPVIFLAVAAFLLNVVLSRIVQLQRPEIATLKAVGYSDREIGLHYLQFVLAIVALGAVIGAYAGYKMGEFQVGLYVDFFKFPVFDYALDVGVVLASVAASLAAAVAGAIGTVVRVMRLPPAEAMRAPAPTMYRRTLLERIGLYRVLTHSMRMIVRDLERRSLRFLISWLGIAAAVGLLVASRAMLDGITTLLDLQFAQVQREDLSITFVGPRPPRAARELARLPGVVAAEGHRMLPVRLANGHLSRETVVWGVPPQARLRRIVDAQGRVVAPPSAGLLLSESLAEILDIRVGEQLRVEVLEGDRRTYHVEVQGVVDDLFGLQAYMQADALHRLVRQQPSVSMVALLVVDDRAPEIYERLKRMPQVLGVNRRHDVLRRFSEQLDDTLLFVNLLMAVIASVITVGVVYNNARITLSMRRRDLASLRVLGFTRGEVSFILLGEQALQVLLALPVGFVFGAFLAQVMMTTVDPEIYRVPVQIAPRTYVYVTAVTLLAAMVSAAIVRRQLNRIDLTEVLKARE